MVEEMISVNLIPLLPVVVIPVLVGNNDYTPAVHFIMLISIIPPQPVGIFGSQFFRVGGGCFRFFDTLHDLIVVSSSKLDTSLTTLEENEKIFRSDTSILNQKII